MVVLMSCPVCGGSGRVLIEVPCFADGGWMDCEQLEIACNCNPAATDAEALDVLIFEG